MHWSRRVLQVVYVPLSLSVFGHFSCSAGYCLNIAYYWDWFSNSLKNSFANRDALKFLVTVNVAFMYEGYTYSGS